MSYIILDRDGVINHESSNYIRTPEEWHAIPGSLEAIAALNRSGFSVLIATNQSGVARGYYDLAALDAIHEKMMGELAAVGGYIEEIFFCPHHPDAGCMCRKPKTGLLQQIQKKYPINLSQTFFIGDSLVDVEAARSSGCLPIIVQTGNGRSILEKHPHLLNLPHFINLAGAVEYVLSQTH
jgi:D-glycero-D-manno-heptose 1,7-bisphosphate phosphatase